MKICNSCNQRKCKTEFDAIDDKNNPICIECSEHCQDYDNEYISYYE